MTIFRKSFGPTAENQNCSYIDQLKAELNDILHKNELALNEISDLNARLSAFEQKSGYIDLSLAESRRIAAETENKANFKAETILNEAQIVAAAHEKQMALLDLEIAELRNQLAVSNPDTGSPPTDVKQGYTVLEMSAPQAAAENRASVPPPESSPGPGYLLNTEADENRLKPVKIRGNNNHYSMQLVAFVNARHFVSFGGKNGPVHAHSWQAQIEVEVPGDKEEIIGVAQISSAVTSALQPYENTVLNYAYPFNKIQPTTENIAMYFFNCLEDALLNIGLNLTLITLWETPTRGIQVNTRNNEFDTIVQSEEDSEQTAMEIAAMREQAVAADIAFKEQINNMFELIRIKRPLRVTSEWAEGPRRPPYPWGKYAFAVLIITLSALAVYHSLLFPPFEQRFPWGSDTWGHLFKADYLYHEILKGNFYPQFTEYWYNGTQPFRYWAPLPYYVLALLEAISGDIFTAGNLFIVLCALGGGLSWLLLSRWMGIWPAAMSGVIWLLWQDNVRVALSEGNVPRILATALLPCCLLFSSVL
jgi:6-pyruvoyl-tetrahydropterin synthase